jgi:hypothetical protein
MALGEYFRRWVAGLGMGEHLHLPYRQNPRFQTCLVIDAESLASLCRIPDELPPLRCAVDKEEKRDFNGPGADAWLWMLETQYMERPDVYEGLYSGWLADLHADPYRGWLRAGISDIETSWFAQLSRQCMRDFRLPHEEIPQGSGIFYYGEAW